MACPSATRYLGCELRQALQQLGSASASALLCLVAIIGSVNAGETTLASGEVKTTVTFNGRAVLPSHGSAAGVWAFLRSDTDPQMLLLGHPQTTSGPCYRAVLQLNGGDRVRITFPVPDKRGTLRLRAVGLSVDGSSSGEAVLRVGKADGTGAQFCQARVAGTNATELFSPTIDGVSSLFVEVVAERGSVALRLEQMEWRTAMETDAISLDPVRRPWSRKPTACSTNMHAALQRALIEWDWRMQDGIVSPQEPRSYAQAIEKRTAQIDRLADNLGKSGVDLADLAERWAAFKETVAAGPQSPGLDWESLWREMHDIRRTMVLKNPLFDVGPLVFVKHVPSAMSHQLTQVYGYAARPGGGIFVLDEPGRSMAVRSLTGQQFPPGNFMHSEVSFDGDRVYFAFCEAEESPERWRDPNTMDRHYQIYEMSDQGTDIRKLTDGNFDHFNPTCLPNGKLMLVSTRRGGFHRCGGGPCYVYTLTLMDPTGSPDGSTSIYPVSFHETNEWDPTVLNSGRILYTRWDYVDRDAVFYQNLWTVRPDGTDVRTYFGNHTFSPTGIWESRTVPGSDKVVAIAGPHHGMSAGSVILLDTTAGVDGSAPITRLTPEVRFPEAEVPLPRGVALPAPSEFDSRLEGAWNGNRKDRPADRMSEVPEEELRWSGHCYRSPLPLSEDYFIVSYSFDRLVGEPGPNVPNMFGIYFADRFGNRELIYRDPNISSLWAKPLRPRSVLNRLRSQLPPRAVATEDATKKGIGTFYLQNVYESWPVLPAADRITHLRIIQVLPKTTPNANQPRVGMANASPGKQVLGTVPVEEDGSAYFEVPAQTPVLFQALDSQGRAVQTMRSLTYLQPGENASCIGCHEDRMKTFIATDSSIALNRERATIEPGPDGSNPLSFPVLVQPVLDRRCVSCHNSEKPEGNVVLTGEPEQQFSRSYCALIERVSYSAWGRPNGNQEPLTRPDVFGARASKLVQMLEEGHENVVLNDDDWNRINTWIDANALFYGTFDPTDQARQLRGERIDGPALE